MERHLAAVPIADVVGYSRLSQIDEEGKRARFQTDLKEVFQPKITEHHGRLVKTIGDGVLVEFHSVVDALRCAVEIQHEKADRNTHEPPEERGSISASASTSAISLSRAKTMATASTSRRGYRHWQNLEAS